MPCDYQRHYFSFARREAVEPIANVNSFCLLLASGLIASDGLLNCIQEILVTKWFCEKIHRPGFDSLHAHRDVAVTGHEDDGEFDIALSELTLEIETPRPWQAHV